MRIRIVSWFRHLYCVRQIPYLHSLQADVDIHSVRSSHVPAQLLTFSEMQLQTKCELSKIHSFFTSSEQLLSTMQEQHRNSHLIRVIQTNKELSKVATLFTSCLYSLLFLD